MNTSRSIANLDEQQARRHTGSWEKRGVFLKRLGHAGVRLGLPVTTGIFIVWNLLAIYTLIIDPHYNDFGRFYYSASAFLDGHAMYGPKPRETVQLGESLGPQFGNLNPPHFHLLLLPVAFFSPAFALVFWGILSLFSLVASLYLIIKESGLELSPQMRRVSVLALLGFVGTSTTLVTGQVSFLLLLPVTLAWAAARRGQWTRTGAHLGLAMSVKPFLFIFLPYFFLRRQLQAGLAAIGTVLICFIVGLCVFGLANHQGWLQTLTAVSWSSIHSNTSILGFLTRILTTTPALPLAQTLDFVKILWLSLAGVIGLFTFGVILRDSTATAVDRHFALLLLAALLISPLGWIYYWWLPFGPFFVLVMAWRQEQQGTLPVPSLVRWRNRLFLLALPGLFCPLPTIVLFPSQLWVKASIGSIYFWTTLFLWMSLIADSRRSLRF